MKWLLLLLIVWPTRGSAIPKTGKGYSAQVRQLTGGQSDVPTAAIYVGPSVLAPGAYAFAEGMKIADAVKLAGGLALPKGRRAALLRIPPMSIAVYRPSKTDPDPAQPIFRCPFDIKSPPDYGMSKCGQQLKPGDLILIQDLTRFIIP